MSGQFDEFAWIDQLRPLTFGDERALSLADDAAVLAGRPGFDLVISKDAMVEGVHLIPGEAPIIVGRRLLRTSLSDLAAKAATPFGYFLSTALPPTCDQIWRDGFIEGLAQDGRAFNVALLGGDTVATPGPLTLSATVLGWVRKGRCVRRSGAKAGDVLVACGPIGDGWLGLQAAKGLIADPAGLLALRYRLPEPLLVLAAPLIDLARAAIDVSDGLLADAGHLADASGLAVEVELDRLPLSKEARAWLEAQSERTDSLLKLATGGDDYSLACAVDPKAVAGFLGAVRTLGVMAHPIGLFRAGNGVRASLNGRDLDLQSLGWRHRF